MVVFESIKFDLRKLCKTTALVLALACYPGPIFTNITSFMIDQTSVWGQRRQSHHIQIDHTLWPHLQLRIKSIHCLPLRILRPLSGCQSVPSNETFIDKCKLKKKNVWSDRHRIISHVLTVRTERTFSFHIVDDVIFLRGRDWKKSN